MPTISVIVPVYKVEQYLDRCVQSILSQTFSSFELILVDDGSPDNCPFMCDEYAKQDDRVVVIHQKNGGLSAARNAGIDWAFANSDSEWLTFIDSDDWVHPEYLERLYCAAVENNVKISVCGFESTGGEEVVVEASKLAPTLKMPEELFVTQRVTTVIACAKLYKKVCFQTIRYPIRRIHEDEFVTYQVLFKQERIAFISAPLYAYYRNQNSIMASTNLKEQRDMMEALAAQAIFFKQNGFKEAYAYSVNQNLGTFVGGYYERKESLNSRRNVRQIRRYLRKFLRNHQLLISEHTLEYKIAYPIGVEVYWMLKAIVTKVKK